MPFLLSRGCTHELIEKGCSPPVGCEAAIKSHPLTRIEAKQCATSCVRREKKGRRCPACEKCEQAAMQDPATTEGNCSFIAVSDGCGDHSKDPQGRTMAEDYLPFDSPPQLMEPCSCFLPNGTYSCRTIPDHGNHMEPAAGCSFDLLAGVMWFQRQKQYLLANGIAVVVANTRLFDGWNIDLASWKTGEDPVRPPSCRQPSLDPNMPSCAAFLRGARQGHELRQTRADQSEESGLPWVERRGADGFEPGRRVGGRDAARH